MVTSDHLIDNLMEWERRFESADLEKHKKFLQEAQLPVCDNPHEATAWENGFVPEARGIPSDQLFAAPIRRRGATILVARLAVRMWWLHQGV